MKIIRFGNKIKYDLKEKKDYIFYHEIVQFYPSIRGPYAYI